MAFSDLSTCRADWSTECFISYSWLSNQNVKKVKLAGLFSILEIRTKKPIFPKYNWGNVECNHSQEYWGQALLRQQEFHSENWKGIHLSQIYDHDRFSMQYSSCQLSIHLFHGKTSKYHWTNSMQRAHKVQSGVHFWCLRAYRSLYHGT